MRKFVIIFCLLILVVHVVQIIYFQRSTFTEKYDVGYWKDRYEHSQYQLPLSKRIIGDDGLHAYAGYRLIHGDDPFSINIDKPPAGKYFFGLSILLFQNPLYIVLFFGFCTLLIFYFIAKHFLKDTNLALLATTFLFLDPLFFTQFWITALDLIQLFFLLLNILLLINIEKSRRWNTLLALGSGLSLGLFVEVKPPIILPAIFILETAFFIYKGLKKEYLFFFLGLLMGVILPYLRFIYLGNEIIDVLKVHKFVASIYLQSQLKVHMEAIWTTLLVGKFPNVVTGALTNVSEWWILWTFLTFFGITMAIFSLFAKNIPILNRGLSIFLLVVIIIYTVIPSYPRYLVIVLPFLYLFGVKFTQSFSNAGRALIYLIVLLCGIVNAFFFLLPKPESFLNSLYYNLSRLYFHDIYQENISSPSTLGLTRNQFRYISNKALGDAGVKMIEVKELSKNISMFASTADVKIRLIYKTQDLGEFYEDKVVKLVKKEDKWKIKWDWGIIFDDFSRYHRVESQIISGRRGSIINRNGTYLARDINGYLLSVNPEKIDTTKEQLMLNKFSTYGYRGDVAFQNAYLENVLPGSYIPILTLSQEIPDKEKSLLLLSYPGVSLTPYASRIFSGIDARSIDNSFYKECCTRIYSSYNYHGYNGLEKEHDHILWGYSGGKILIKDKNGDVIRIVLEKNKKDGRDVIVQ